MKLHIYVQYYLGLSFAGVLQRRIAGLAKAEAKAKDGIAYAKAMAAYHTAQVNELGLTGAELLEAQLAMLEAQEGIDYAQSLLDYYTLRRAQVQLLLNTYDKEGTPAYQ